MDILIGTKNKFKIAEMEWVVGDDSEIRLHYMDEIPPIKVDENQPTLLKNAEKKAREISQFTDWYVLTSDGGVDIPELKDKWDMLKSQRMVGEDRTDREKVEKLLEIMKGLHGEERRAAYHFALALAKNGRIIWSKEDICERGIINEETIKEEIPPHRWIGSVWFYPEFKKIELELSEVELNIVRQRTRRSLKIALKKEIASLKD